MKLSMWSSYYMDLSPEDAVLELEKQGYQYSELSDEHAAVLLSRGGAKEAGREFKKFADAHNVSFLQGHLLLQIRLCDESSPVVETLKNWLGLFEAIGIKSAVLHCDGMNECPELTVDEIREKNAAVLRQLVQHLDGKDMTICLENLIAVHEGIDDLLWYIEHVGSDHLGICLDTGHLNFSSNKDQEYFIHKAGKHLKALHIADNEGKTDQHMMPFGKGNVDIVSVVRALKEIGYDRLFNFEIPGERGCPIEIRGYKLQYLKKVFDFLMK